MPVDSVIQGDRFTQEAIRNMSRFTWKKTWTAWPRRCRLSRKRMPWFSVAYRGYRIISGPGEDLLLVRWLS